MSETETDLNETVELSSEVAQIAASVAPTPEGKFAIAEEQLPSLAALLLQDATQETRRRHAQELLALVLKYSAIDAERTAPACQALAVLMTLVLGDFLSAERALQGAGASMSKAQMDAVGAQAASLQPIVKQAGGLSPMDIRMGKK